MLPHLAQGGVLAWRMPLSWPMPSLLILAMWPERCYRFEALRRRRAARVQAMSRRQRTCIYHLRPPLSWARDGVLRVLPGAWLMAGYDWLYGWRSPHDNARR